MRSTSGAPRRPRILQSTVETFEPRACAYDVWDAEMRGLVMRVQPTGLRTFYFVYRLRGRQSRYRLGAWPAMSPDGARKVARRIVGEIAIGDDPNLRRQAERREAEIERASTLRTFLESQYADWARTHLRSAEYQLERLRSDFAEWLDRPMAELTPWLIEKYRKRRRDAGVAPVTINREIQRLRALVAKAVAFGVLQQHPFGAVRPLRIDKAGRVRFLTPDEERSLREALVRREERVRAARDRFNAWRKVRHLEPLPQRQGAYVDHVRPLVLLAMNTGMRRGELLKLRWGEVNLEAKVVTVAGASAKSGQTRRIPLTGEAHSVLTTWRQQSKEDGREAYVFAHGTGRGMARVDTAWRTVNSLAGLVDFRFHDLRHHFASRLVMAGVPLNHVRELLGHSTLEMTQRYAHLGPDDLASAVAKLAQVGT